MVLPHSGTPSSTNSTLVDSLIYSLIIAVLSTLISVFIGTIGALGLKRYEFKMKKFIDNMLYIPIIVPEIVLAVALLIIFLKVGVSMGMGTILIGHCTFCIPYAIVTIKGRISGDNETLEEASMDLGANRVQTLLRVTLPNIFPGVMSADSVLLALLLPHAAIDKTMAPARTVASNLFFIMKTSLFYPFMKGPLNNIIQNHRCYDDKNHNCRQ